MKFKFVAAKDARLKQVFIVTPTGLEDITHLFSQHDLMFCRCGYTDENRTEFTRKKFFGRLVVDNLWCNKVKRNNKIRFSQ